MSKTAHWIAAARPGGWIDGLRQRLQAAKAALSVHKDEMTPFAFESIQKALKIADNPLLDKVMRAIKANAEDTRYFDDAVGFGGDFQVCIFCTEDNRKDTNLPVVHKPDCVYLDAVAYLKDRPDA